MRRTTPSVRVAILTLLSAIAMSAHAEGLELGLGTYPFDGFSLGARAVLPLFEMNDVQHAGRADVAYGFSGLPAFSVSYLLRGGPVDSQVVRYLGAGVGVSFASEPLGSVLVSGHGLAGLRVPLYGGLAAFGEVVVAGNGLGSRLSLGAGVSFAFGGDR